MKKINNKGFTLVEVLAVIAIIAILGGIALPNILSTINSGKEASKKTMINNIKTAAQELFEEVYYMESDLKKFEINDESIVTETTESIKVVNDNDSNSITVNLQTLVSNGFLIGTGENEETKKIYDPKTNEYIGDCEIIITKDSNGNYTITNEGGFNDESKCPNLGE